MVGLFSKNVLQNYLYYGKFFEPKKYRTIADKINKAMRIQREQKEKEKENENKLDDNDEFLQLPRHMHKLFQIVELFSVEKRFFWGNLDEATIDKRHEMLVDDLEFQAENGKMSDEKKILKIELYKKNTLILKKYIYTIQGHRNIPELKNARMEIKQIYRDWYPKKCADYEEEFIQQHVYPCVSNINEPHAQGDYGNYNINYNRHGQSKQLRWFGKSSFSGSSLNGPDDDGAGFIYDYNYNYNEIYHDDHDNHKYKQGKHRSEARHGYNYSPPRHGSTKQRDNYKSKRRHVDRHNRKSKSKKHNNHNHNHNHNDNNYKQRKQHVQEDRCERINSISISQSETTTTKIKTSSIVSATQIHDTNRNINNYNSQNNKNNTFMDEENINAHNYYRMIGSIGSASSHGRKNSENTINTQNTINTVNTYLQENSNNDSEDGMDGTGIDDIFDICMCPLRISQSSQGTDQSTISGQGRMQILNKNINVKNENKNKSKGKSNVKQNIYNSYNKSNKQRRSKRGGSVRKKSLSIDGSQPPTRKLRADIKRDILYSISQFESILDNDESNTQKFENLVRDDEKEFLENLSDKGWICLQEIWLSLKRPDQTTSQKCKYFEREMKFFLKKYDVS